MVGTSRRPHTLVIVIRPVCGLRKPPMNPSASNASASTADGQPPVGCEVSVISDGLKWVEIKVPSLERALAFWHPLLTELGYEGCQAWDQGRSYALGDNRVLFIEAAEVTATQPTAVPAAQPKLRFQSRALSGFKLIKDHLAEAGIVLRQISAKSKRGAMFCHDPNGIRVELVGA
jgi:hypothetical protein